MVNTISVKKFAEAAGVSPNMVYRWIYGGTLKTVQIVSGGRHMIPNSEVKRLLTFEPMTEAQPAPEAPHAAQG